MAWLDDRVWCHPKVIGLTDKSFRVWVGGIAYSSGMSTAGHLTNGQVKLIGGNARIVKELLESGLWEPNGDGIVIHDWDEHNARRDARRKADRERKRQEREADPDGWITRTGKWQDTRRKVFERDAGVCVDCGDKTEGWHADHVPDRRTLRERGDDPFDPQWIQTRCHSCHSRRHRLDTVKKQRTDKGQNGQKGTDR